MLKFRSNFIILLRLHTWSWMFWLDLFEHSYMAIIFKKSYRYLHSIYLKKGFYLPQSFIFLNVTSAIFNILWFQWSCNNRKKGHNDNTNLSNLSFVKRMKHDRCSNLAIIKSQILIHTFSFSLRIHLTFGATTTGFPAKWRLRNEHRNSILMTCHYLDLGQNCASDVSY